MVDPPYQNNYKFNKEFWSKDTDASGDLDENEYKELKDKWSLSDILPPSAIQWPEIDEKDSKAKLMNIHYILAVDKGF